MASRLHALLSRGYVKGRDIYDLLWYLSRSEPTVPNIALLRNAKSVIELQLREANFAEVAADVSPFLESSDERALLTLPIVLATLHQ